MAKFKQRSEEMKTIRKYAFIWFVMISFFMSVPASYAKYDCPADKGSGAWGSGRQRGGYECPVTAKFFGKADFILANKDELGLTEEQISKAKQLKLDVQKSTIRQMADLQVLMLDVEAKLVEPKVDVEGINALLDQGFASMAAATKGVVFSYAELKAVLSDDQMTKLKSLWQGRRSRSDK